jgi:L-ectoine synthase
VDTEREVKCPRGGFVSLRALLAKDGMGFSLHKTIVPVGPPQHWHYKHHLEACYCIAGRGILTNYKTGEAFTIEPDSVYVLDKHDEHSFQALEEVVLISVFNPPVTGTEVHGEDGSYEATNDATWRAFR